jgi:hypothetical protein
MESEAPAEAADTDGNIFLNRDEVVIGAEGTVDAVFLAKDPGPLPVAAEGITSVLTVIAGWDSITNEERGDPGRPVESDADFRNRIKNLVAQNGSGTLASLLSYIRTLDGVEDCQGRENYTAETAEIAGYNISPHRYAIAVLGGANADIAKAIYEKKSASLQDGNTTIHYYDEETETTYDFKIIRPTRQDWKIRVTVENQASLPGNITVLIKQALYDDFYGITADSERITIASTTYASRFYTALNDVYPGMQISNIELSTDGGTTYGSSVTTKLTQYPSIQTADIIIEFGS